MTASLYMTGPELRALRIAFGLSQFKFGAWLGIDYPGYSATVQRVVRLERRGIRSDVRDEGLRARVDALRATLERDGIL